MSVPGKDGDNGVVEFQFYQPDNRTKWEAFQKSIYDKSSNQFCGRTPKSWGQLLIFYSIFYIVLAALFAICMQGLFATLEERQPKWKLRHSLIGVNPGLGFRPISEKPEEGSLIWFNVTNATTTEKWVNLIEKFLEPYKANQTGKNMVNCTFEGQLPGKDEVCMATVEDFGRCNGSIGNYGYDSFSPCVFLKLNRIIDWIPLYFNTSQPHMPSSLTDYIKEITIQNTSESRIWVSCNGVTDLDKENIKDFNYYPKGFSSYYYPFKNVENYLSPIVAVEIVDIKPNVVIQVECRAWAKNIEYRGGSLNRAGSVTFEIQVDGPYKPPVEAKTSSGVNSSASTLSGNLKEEKVATNVKPETNKTEVVTVNATVFTASTA